MADNISIVRNRQGLREIADRHIDQNIIHGALSFFFNKIKQITVFRLLPKKQVGIDPEMLGHIFENLLEDNRDKGAFYTPKEIGQYMCKESLIQYLLNTFQEQKDIEAFIRFHEPI